MRRPLVGVPCWARGGAVALVTAPGVLLAHLATAGSAPPLLACAVVGALAWIIAWAAAEALPAGGAAATAAAAGLAQLAGHAVLAVAVPGDAAGGGCLSVVGRGAGALVASAPSAGACPPGAVPVPPGVTAVFAAVFAAVLVLVAHGLLAAVTGALVTAAATAVTTVRALAAAVFPGPVDPSAVRLPVVGVRPWRAPEPQRLQGLWRPGTPARRGPPAVPATA